MALDYIRHIVVACGLWCGRSGRGRVSRLFAGLGIVGGVFRILITRNAAEQF
ncbi:MAG: hypothetical protein K2K39_03755 [Clostridia bacterium]|nr:hypothetical protein [Clostridia bacterium]